MPAQRAAKALVGAVECDPFAALFADVSSADASMDLGILRVNKDTVEDY